MWIEGEWVLFESAYYCVSVFAEWYDAGFGGVGADPPLSFPCRHGLEL